MRDLALLHGDLPIEQQARAVATGRRRKLILSTNIAETSLTIEGVRTVIDSGLARRAGHSPWTGLPTLETVPISRASATQRAGRAGRLGPGRCIRLYGRHDFDGRAAFDPAEIMRSDLSEAWLMLARQGAARDLELFEAPPAAAVTAAEALLCRLGAINERGQVTQLGCRIVHIPLHPRLARLLIEANTRGMGAEGALLAALLSEREIWPPARNVSERELGALEPGLSDLLDRLDRMEALEADGVQPHRIRAHGLDVKAVQAVLRTRDQLVRIAAAEPGAESHDMTGDEALRMCILAAFGDRVAKRRPGTDTWVFAGGGAAQRAPMSVVRDAELVVITEADQRATSGRAGAQRVVAHQVTAIEPEWLLELFPDAVISRSERIFEASSERVFAVERLLYDGLVLDESRTPASAGPETAAVLRDAVNARGLEALADESERLSRWRLRLAFAARHTESIDLLDESDLAQALLQLCEDCTSFSELRAKSLLHVMQARLTPAQQSMLASLAPEHVTLGGNRQLAVHYEPDREPWVASRLQDFFGLGEGPRVAQGKVPLVLHLLAPNQRAVQVTTDLAGFWATHYPALRKQLMRRYPRHAWPEDPLHSQPPPPRPRRSA